MNGAGALRGVQTVGGWLLDFALPPRCPGCGEITTAVDLFCGECWGSLEFLNGGCDCCGLALKPGDDRTCLTCERSNGPLGRVRAAIAYGEVSRSIAMRLKYGRKIALAKTMAGMMKRPMHGLDPEAMLVPVPLHRWRLWGRGFNQSVLITRAMKRPMDGDLLRRIRATPRLKGLNPSQRRRTVERAFSLRPGAKVGGRSFILVDDVITTGATAEACAKVLCSAGASSVDLIAFARVIG